ncbi:MAG: hypothetical protein OER80_09170 [Gammaproteobacteria bacterium]|nr:hypothetical protein [Gammaproteobacteria bacterium]MDH3768609.1 hypothetical protein [Gammaproteobacteria bacterium]
MKLFIVFALLAIPLSATADMYAGERPMGPIYYTAANDRVSIGVGSLAGLSDSTCNWYGHVFTFLANTSGGEKMLTLFTAAKTSNHLIRIWYLPSSTPGTDHTSGCTEATMAVVTRVSIF